MTTSGTGSDRCSATGMTLVEVLVAAVIVFAGLGAVLGGYAMAAKALDGVADTMAATEIARERGADVALSGGAAPSGMSGARDVRGRRYEWQVTASASTAGGGIAELLIDVWRTAPSSRYRLTTQWARIDPVAGKE